MKKSAKKVEICGKKLTRSRKMLAKKRKSRKQRKEL